MKAVGFPWRPRVGDWFMSHNGFCEIVRTHDQAQRLGENGDIFLPRWEDCRTWLASHGWGHPEVSDEDDGGVRMTLTHESGELVRANGDSDLDCLYQVILRLLLRRTR